MSNFLSKIQKKDDGCWLFMSDRRKHRYGALGVNGKRYMAHRYAYELWVGEIPQGFVIDHLCKNTRCVNPEHLEAVTQRDNVLRGNGIAAVNAQKTECLQGHLFDKHNTYLSKKGRECKECRREATRRWRVKYKEVTYARG